jgi:Domain of unknown function (DUF4388)
MPQGSKGAVPSGFQGSIGSLPLSDLLQLWSLNRFSGLVTVRFEGETGRLYFADGEIVHADAGDLAGEAAARVIIGWPEGQFEIAENTTTLNRTIHKSLSHLLLDTHRELDERRRASGSPRRGGPPVASQGNEPSPPGVLERIRAIRGVTRLVRFGNDGRPVGGGGLEAEALAARALYLAVKHAAAVASSFGLKEVALATLESERDRFILVRGSTGFLCVEVETGVAPDSIVAELRTLLSRPASRSP